MSNRLVSNFPIYLRFNLFKVFHLNLTNIQFIVKLNSIICFLFTKSLIQLGHDLQLKIIAEGVETEAELAFLRENGCDAIQGFIYSPALHPLEFQKLLFTNKSFSI